MVKRKKLDLMYLVFAVSGDNKKYSMRTRAKSYEDAKMIGANYFIERHTSSIKRITSVRAL